MSDFQPKDPDYRARVMASFGRQTVMHTLGIALVDLGPGRIVLAMPHRVDLCQQHGFLHGGIVATGLDSACGYAASSLMPAEAGVLTVEFKTSLLAPAQGERFIFRGRVIKPGRTLTFCEALAYAESNGSERLIATVSATLMAIFDREGIRH
jgi:uncharacterized protein (TIGR00369 family)